jgi:hypothetical protein
LQEIGPGVKGARLELLFRDLLPNEVLAIDEHDVMVR